MLLELNLPHVFRPDASAAENAEVLAEILESWVRINMLYLKRHPEAPTVERLISSGRLRYDRTTIWECLPGLISKGIGDCKSLAPADVACLRVRENIPARCVFRHIQRPNGKRDFHILVQTPRGWRDPSRDAGMGANENAPRMY